MFHRRTTIINGLVCFACGVVCGYACTVLYVGNSWTRKKKDNSSSNDTDDKSNVTVQLFRCEIDRLQASLLDIQQQLDELNHSLKGPSATTTNLDQTDDARSQQDDEFYDTSDE